MWRAADTSPEAHRRQTEMYRAMSPTERLRLAVEISDAVRRLAESGARRRLGGSSDGVADDLSSWLHVER
jgi:hypothetical protein